MPSYPNHWQNKAKQLQAQLRDQGYRLFFGIEKEFYIAHALSAREYKTIRPKLLSQYLWKVIEEDGERQFEYHTPPTCNLGELFTLVETIESGIQKLTNHQAVFLTKPYEKEPSSGLHIHMHLEDIAHTRLFTKDKQKLSYALSHCLAGLIYHLEETAALLMLEAPSDRFDHTQDHIATTVSWGYNNRTVAIRLPDSPADAKRIEFRIASSQVDVAKLLAIMCASILDGMMHNYPLQAPTYGDASDAQYKLPKFPKNIQQAEQVLTKKITLRHLLA